MEDVKKSTTWHLSTAQPILKTHCYSFSKRVLDQVRTLQERENERIKIIENNRGRMQVDVKQ
jgi:hypothetical protein